MGAFGGEIAEENLEFENTQKVEGEGEEKGEEKPDHGGRLKLEAPPESLAGGAKENEESGEGEQGEKDTEGVSKSLPAGGGGALVGDLHEVEGFERENGKDAGHDVEDETSKKGEEEGERDGRG